jgi:hypothetical protein
MSTKTNRYVPENFELPKSVNVGDLYQTVEARSSARTIAIPYDLRVLAIIFVNPNGESHSMEYMSLQQHDVRDSSSRTIIVTEQLNPELEQWKVVEAFCWEPHAELREDFIIRMGAAYPVLYSPPDVEQMIRDAIYGRKALPPDAPARKVPDLVFLSSEAYQVMDQKSKRADVGRIPLGPKGAVPILMYDEVRMVEVPGIKGIRVWSGYE